MKIKTIQAAAAKCSSTTDAAKILRLVEDEVGKSKLIRCLSAKHSISTFNENSLHVRHEVSRVFGEEYKTAITHELTSSKLTVCVKLFKLNSENKAWTELSEYTELIDGLDDESIADLVSQAYNIAIQNYASIIEKLGVPEKASIVAAKAAWALTSI